MTFVILGFDGPDGQTKRKVHRAAPIWSCGTKKGSGKTYYGRPFTDQAGSLIILEANSLQEARRIAEEDPYTVHGIFEKIEVHPFQQVLPPLASTLRQFAPKIFTANYPNCRLQASSHYQS